MSATIIAFPKKFRPRLSSTAQSVYDDLVRLYWDGEHFNGDLPHSINDGIRCSGANGPKVVAARRELIGAGIAVRTRDGDCYGPATWLLPEFADDLGHQPTGSA